jgi:hypothetical protein
MTQGQTVRVRDAASFRLEKNPVNIVAEETWHKYIFGLFDRREPGATATMINGNGDILDNLHGQTFERE